MPQVATDGYFFNPKLEAQFEPIPLPSALAAPAAGAQNIDPNDPVFNIVGQNIPKTRLRAHPDVAEKYYSWKVLDAHTHY